MTTFFGIVSFLFTSNLWASQDLTIDNQKVDTILTALCSLTSNHASSVYSPSEFHFHHWKIIQNSSRRLEVTGACAVRVDVNQNQVTAIDGEKFHIDTAVEPTGREYTLEIEFTHGYGSAHFVRESIFNPKTQNLEPRWNLQVINYTPSLHESSLLNKIPLARWALKALKPVQQTNYRVSPILTNDDSDFSVRLNSTRDLFTMDMWSSDAGRTIQVNMDSFAQFQWGRVPRSKLSDAIFLRSDSNKIWGCSNFIENQSGTVRGNMSAQACSLISERILK